MVTIRRAYDGSRVAVTVDCEGFSRTKQSFKEECDINNIMKKFEKTGVVSHVKQYGGSYGDISDAMDYKESVELVIKAQDMFMTLPAKLRSRFGNNPAEFLDFVSDPSKKAEMKDLGLLREGYVEPPAATGGVVPPVAGGGGQGGNT